MLHKTIPDREHLAQAKALEADGEADEAIEIYQRVLKGDPLNETAIGRLLVLYRRQKEYKLELALLQSAISAYEAVQLEAQGAWRKKNQKAARISLALAKKLGIAGRKKEGPIYDDRLVTTWRKRKALVMKRLKDGQGLRVVKGVKGAARGKATGSKTTRGKTGTGTARKKTITRTTRKKTITGTTAGKTKTRRGHSG